MTEGNQLKIIFSSYDSIGNPFYGGGGAIAVHEVARRLAKKYDVTVIAGKYPKSINTVIDGVRYERIGTSLFGPKASQLIFQFMLLLSVMIKKFDVWVENFTPPFSTAFLPLFTRRPVIGLVHMLAGKDMQRKYKLPFRYFESLGLKVYRSFITVTDESKDEVLSVNPKARVETVHNGVRFPAAKKYKKHPYILFLGRVEVGQKGLDLLLEAYGRIRDDVGLKLVIAGSGSKEEEKKLGLMVERLGLKNKVELAGRVEGEEKNRMYQEAMISVVSSRFETFSLAALESLAFGLPLITFDIEGLKWIPENASVKVKPFEIQGLASAMLHLARNGHLRKTLEINGMELAKKFSWDKASVKYEDFIVSVFGQNKLHNSVLKTYG